MIPTQTQEMRASVREGYQILLRAQAKLILPSEQVQIAEYYTSLANACMTWAVDVEGERLRNAFLSMEDPRDRARFRMREYRFEMRYPWEREDMVAVLCESYLSGQSQSPETSYHRIAHTWNLLEQTVLPARQILSLFGLSRMPKEVQFRPDGVYPRDDFLVFFKNPRENSPFEETKVAISGGF